MGDMNEVEVTNAGKSARSRVLRYDQVYDIQTSRVQLIKSVKPNVKKQNSRKAVLVVRRLIDNKGIYSKTEVDIKSTRLAQIMQEINSTVQGISLLAKPPVVPLELFYHNRLQLQAALKEAEKSIPVDEDLVEELKIATKFAMEEHADIRASLEHLLVHNEITWELLWAIFPPNVLIYRYHRLVEQDQIMKLRSLQPGTLPDKSRYWKFDCDIVADDGTKFGLAMEPFSMIIGEFVGTRRVTDLEVFPLDFHPRAEILRKATLERGRRFTAITDPRVMQTSGPAMFEKRDSRNKPYTYKFTTHGRAIIDPEGFRTFNPNIAFIPVVRRALSREELSDEQFMICTPIVFGFSFGDKKWGGFAMSRLHDITWNDQAFQELVIDKQSKMLIHAMVKQNSFQDDDCDDIISGKGMGMIGLFSGPPGCGKTLTAEAVAEITKRPLYSVSAGDLGVEPQEVDKKLTQILEFAYRWNAVLLLDEADVFLQERNQQDVKRNALVSIFLRQLEYFQGILFLTTNRIARCDIAFKSRIHIFIEYPGLDASARKQVWNVLLKKAKGTENKVAIELSDDEVNELSKIEINGRQIKNIIRGARMIAKEKEESLSISKVKLVLSVVDTHIKVF